MRGNIIICLCLLFSSAPGWRGYAQEASQTQPAALPRPQDPAASAPAGTAQSVQPKTAPAKSAPSEPYITGDGEFSVGIAYWQNPGTVSIRPGKSATSTNPSYFDFTKNNGSGEAEMNIPLGKFHTLRLSYFRVQESGNQVISNDINLFGVDYLKGQTVSGTYTLQNARMSVDYTSWPFPVKNARFRVKTFWELQYTTMRAATDAPLEPTTDADGNFVNHAGGKTHWFLYPSLGMGIEYMLSKSVRFEMKGSGFYVPNHANIWDADARLAYRKGRLELGLGGRAFHFKTSSQPEELFRGTLPGVYVGARWYPKP
jgi:hypothetical protein